MQHFFKTQQIESPKTIDQVNLQLQSMSGLLNESLN
jgi:hypothetical protein